MKTTTEAIYHIKMIKLYAWHENFIQRIYRRRVKDLKAQQNRGFVTSLLISNIQMWPSLLPVATFATYIAMGNALKYEIAVAALVLFNLLRAPLIQLPMFLADLI